jgi:hypothetical protein
MNGIRLSRPAALSGAGFFVLGTIGHFTYPHSPAFAARPSAAQAFYAGHHAGILASNTLFLLAGMLLLVFASALRGQLRDTADSRGETVANTVFGAALAGAALMIASAGIDMAGALQAQQQGTVAPGTASALWDISQVLFGLAAPMALAVAVLGCAIGALRDRALPVWLGGLSVALGVALAIPPINHVSMVVFTFWALATSLVLTMRSIAQSQTPPAPASAVTATA